MLDSIHSFIGRLGGKKFLVIIFSIVVCLQNGHIITLTDQQLQVIAYLASAFGIGQGICDGLTGGKTSSVAQNHIADTSPVVSKQDV